MMIILLNPIYRLQNISSVVSAEICDVLRDKTKLPTDITIHERMVRETAVKVINNTHVNWICLYISTQ